MDRILVWVLQPNAELFLRLRLVPWMDPSRKVDAENERRVVVSNIYKGQHGT
jgi:hypothetical protein